MRRPHHLPPLVRAQRRQGHHRRLARARRQRGHPLVGLRHQGVVVAGRHRQRGQPAHALHLGGGQPGATGDLGRVGVRWCRRERLRQPAALRLGQGRLAAQQRQQPAQRAPVAIGGVQHPVRPAGHDGAGDRGAVAGRVGRHDARGHRLVHRLEQAGDRYVGDVAVGRDQARPVPGVRDRGVDRDPAGHPLTGRQVRHPADRHARGSGDEVHVIAGQVAGGPPGKHGRRAGDHVVVLGRRRRAGHLQVDDLHRVGAVPDGRSGKRLAVAADGGDHQVGRRLGRAEVAHRVPDGVAAGDRVHPAGAQHGVVADVAVGRAHQRVRRGPPVGGQHLPDHHPMRGTAGGGQQVPAGGAVQLPGRLQPGRFLEPAHGVHRGLGVPVAVEPRVGVDQRQDRVQQPNGGARVAELNGRAALGDPGVTARRAGRGVGARGVHERPPCSNALGAAVAPNERARR